MELSQLTTFCRVARRLSFSRAAEELCLTQPAVSRHIHALERELGVDLFQRRGRSVLLTDAGRYLLEYGEQILQLAARARQAMEELQNLETGRVTVGASSTMGNYVLPGILAGFMRRYPGIDVALRVGSSRDIAEAISQDRVDLGVLAGPIELPSLYTEPYVGDKLVLVGPPGYRRGEGDGAGVTALLAWLRKEVLILREPGSATRYAVERHLEALEVEPGRHLVFGNTEAIKRAVAAGLGISFLSRYTVEVEVRAGLLSVLEGPDLSIRRQFSIAYRKDTRLSPAALALLAYLRKAAGQSC